MERYHRILISISTSKYFTSQKDMAKFLCISNSSKKSIEARCRVLSFEVEWDE